MKAFHIDPKSVLSCEGELLYGTKDETSDGRRAFLHGDTLTFRARLPRQLGVTRASVVIRCDEDGNRFTLPLRWGGMEHENDVWIANVEASKIKKGLHYLRAELDTVVGKVITVRKDGKTVFAPYNRYEFTYQLLVSDFLYAQPEWLKGGTIYQVFVDRFARGSETPIREDAVYNPDWEGGIPQYAKRAGDHLENNMFFGGNLDGVTQKLPHIASLGVNCIYLTPIFRAYSNHKYDTGDYREVDEMFGGEDALRRLIEAAKTYGIRIVLDGVFNHTGDDSLYFNRRGKYPSVGAYQSKDSPYYAWYEFQSHPDTYTSWWNIDILPRINPLEPSCREYFLGEDGVIAKYARMGIGGFRLDVADELPDSFIRGIKRVLSRENPDSVLYGEVWEDASKKIAYDTRKRYFWGDELDGVMNYEIRRGILSFLRGEGAGALHYALVEVMGNTPKRVQDLQMNLFGTHDTARILTELAGPAEDTLTNTQKATYRLPPDKRAEGIQKLKCAYLILATVPGVPMIYYGDEVGMEGYDDPFNRMPFTWHRIDEDLLGFYRAVGSLRRDHDVYREGAFRLLHLDDTLLVFSREGGCESYVTIVNVGDKERQIHIPQDCEVLFGTLIPKEDGLSVSPMTGAICKVPTEYIS